MVSSENKIRIIKQGDFLFSGLCLALSCYTMKGFSLEVYISKCVSRALSFQVESVFEVEAPEAPGVLCSPMFGGCGHSFLMHYFTESSKTEKGKYAHCVLSRGLGPLRASFHDSFGTLHFPHITAVRSPIPSLCLWALSTHTAHNTCTTIPGMGVCRSPQVYRKQNK